MLPYEDTIRIYINFLSNGCGLLTTCGSLLTIDCIDPSSIHLFGFHLVKSSVEVSATAGINSFTLLTLQI